MYTSTVLGEGKCVLFKKASLIQGVAFKEVPLYCHSIAYSTDIVLLLILLGPFYMYMYFYMYYILLHVY